MNVYVQNNTIYSYIYLPFFYFYSAPIHILACILIVSFKLMGNLLSINSFSLMNDISKRKHS
jgi:hypothetical protein